LPAPKGSVKGSAKRDESAQPAINAAAPAAHISRTATREIAIRRSLAMTLPTRTHNQHMMLIGMAG
jgi:hypothetical protein